MLSCFPQIPLHSCFLVAANMLSVQGTAATHRRKLTYSMAELKAIREHNRIKGLLGLSNELMLKILEEIEVGDLCAFRLIDRRCSDVGCSELTKRTTATTVSLEPNTEALLTLFTISQSYLRKCFTVVKFTLDPKSCSEVPPPQVFMLRKCLESLTLFDKLRTIEFDARVWPLGPLTNMTEEQWHPSTFWWPHELPLVCAWLKLAADAIHYNASSAKTPALRVLFDNILEPPAEVANALSYLLENITEVEVVEKQSGIWLDRFRRSPWNHRWDRVFLGAPNVKKFTLQKFGPLSPMARPIRYGGVDKIANTLFKKYQPGRLHAPFFSSLQCLSIANVVMEKESFYELMRMLGPQLRTFGTTHLALNSGDNAYALPELRLIDLNNKQNGTYEFLKYLSAAKDIRVEICEEHLLRYYSPSRVTTVIREISHIKDSCVTCTFCRSNRCWDFGKRMMDILAMLAWEASKRQ